MVSTAASHVCKCFIHLIEIVHAASGVVSALEVIGHLDKATMSSFLAIGQPECQNFLAILTDRIVQMIASKKNFVDATAQVKQITDISNFLLKCLVVFFKVEIANKCMGLKMTATLFARIERTLLEVLPLNLAELLQMTIGTCQRKIKPIALELHACQFM